MATTTISGVVFELTLEEMIEYSRRVVDMSMGGNSKAPVISAAEGCVTEKVIEKVTQTKAPRNSSAMHEYSCGHLGPKSRGKYSAKCPDCNGGNGNSRRAVNSNKLTFTERRAIWLESEDSLKPATDRQLNRLTDKMREHKLTKRQRSNFEREISEGITGRRAALMNDEISALPKL